MCFVCFSGEPLPDDPFGAYPNMWQTSMAKAFCNSPLCCIGSCFCPCISSYYVRKLALDNDMSRYQCCQGYICTACSGNMKEKSCPRLCLCLEAWCCQCLAVSATRMYIRDRFNIRSDPCDNSLVRFNNCIQLLSCFCDIMAALTDEPLFQQCAPYIRVAGDVIYYSTQACMTTQVYYELTNNPVAAPGGAPIPAAGGAAAAAGEEAPKVMVVEERVPSPAA